MSIAIIPARGGSKRIPGKNIRGFAGKPLIAYSIEVALQSGLFEHVIVSTDSEGREVWVYDKFASEAHHSSTSTGLVPGLIVEGSKKSSSRTHITLTVIVKFDKNSMVRDVAYHRSKF